MMLEFNVTLLLCGLVKYMFYFVLKTSCIECEAPKPDKIRLEDLILRLQNWCCEVSKLKQWDPGK